MLLTFKGAEFLLCINAVDQSYDKSRFNCHEEKHSLPSLKFTKYDCILSITEYRVKYENFFSFIQCESGEETLGDPFPNVNEGEEKK